MGYIRGGGILKLFMNELICVRSVDVLEKPVAFSFFARARNLIKSLNATCVRVLDKNFYD